mmetsp:Transcript_97315/g.308689  ORF Transcript_97315/g.308689 Transcript_97315/m.308689 type:complete len:184 (+) Transcript_97315:411-962(+)
MLAAAEALAGVASSNRVRVEAVRCGALQPLVAMLERGTQEQRAAAASAVGAIANEDELNLEDTADPVVPVFADAFLEAGVLPPLVDLLSSGSPEGRGQAVSATVALMEKSEMHEPFVAAGGLPLLVEFLQARRGDPAQSRAAAALALRTLAYSSAEIREAIETAVPGCVGREELLRTLHSYCF